MHPDKAQLPPQCHWHSRFHGGNFIKRCGRMWPRWG